VPDDSVESLSSLHAVEHFGLGRYGDPLDPLACFTAMRAFARVLAPGGHLYFSVPIGVERVEFNAHRIFDPVRVLDTFAALELVEFNVIAGDGTFRAGVDPADFRDVADSTGLFVFTKPTGGSGRSGRAEEPLSRVT
jgi:hypothetical protein